MDLELFLRNTGIHYEKPAVGQNGHAAGVTTALPGAAAVPARAVLVKGHLGYAVCVLPAPSRLNLEWVAEVLQEFDVQMAADDEADALFQAVEYVACPAGTCGCRTRIIMDAQLRAADSLVIHNGDPAESVRVQRSDWERRLRPIVAEIAEAA